MNAAPWKRRWRSSAAAARPGAALLAAVAVLSGSLCAGSACADGLEGRFEIRSADLDLKDGVYHLNARIDLPVGEAVRRGLAEGVPLGL